MEKLSDQQRVYYFHSQRGWSLGRISLLVPLERRAEIVDEVTGSTEKMMNNLHLIHGFIENSFDPQDPELFRVGDLHVATLLHCVKARCERLRLQYSRMGDMILSVNPFQQMPFNSDGERTKYLEASDPLQLPPHVWQISHKAFMQIIVRNQGNQSVVISGESGSGKTENTKMLINYLGQLSFKHSCNAAQRAIADRVSDRLKWSNPILESFGNARTVRNDNSSRFGKYTKLFFDPVSGVMIGGEMVTYLLEKSRIISIAKGERNYHVFYEMLAGLTQQQKMDLGNLRDAKDYRCLNRGETLTRRGIDGNTVNDSMEFRTLTQAFSHMELSSDVQWSIFKVLAAILHLQDTTFAADANDKACFANDAPMRTACRLLGISFEELKPSFLEKSRSKILTLLASKTEAESLRDAFCKALYVGLFDYLVSVVNAAIQPQQTTGGPSKYIGVLDIFGFENFTRNSFEQMCINFANETLQNHYNKYTFLNDEEECRQEGIQCPQVTFPNNQACLQLFEAPKTGLFALLDEECSVKTGTSAGYTNNVWNLWTSKNEYFIRPKSTIPNEFGVKHYANSVTYNTDEWLEKNSDALKEEAKKAVQGSSDALVRIVLDGIEAVSSDGQMKKRVTVASRFQNQLRALRSELESTETHFIRCVKPNMQATPAVMDNLYVGSQLESAGVLQTIALKRQGYPIRRPLSSFSGYFFLIAPNRARRLHAQRMYAESVKVFLDFYQSLYRWSAPHYAVGKTKVFMRAHIWSTLEKLLVRKKRLLLKRVRPMLQKWVVRFREKKKEAERRRMEQQRLLQQQAAAREEQSRTSGGFDYVATAKRAGLDATKANWFEGIAKTFPNFDLSILLDVIYGVPSMEHAQRALTEMQCDRLGDVLPQMVRRVLLDQIRLRPSVVETLATRGVLTIVSLGDLTHNQLMEMGFNTDEISRLEQYMVSQQSHVVVQERLRDNFGGQGNIAEVVMGGQGGGAGAAAATTPLTRTPSMKAPVTSPNGGGGPANDTDAKIKKLMDMGHSREASIDALGQCRGHLQHASDFLMAGGGGQGVRRASASGAPSSPNGAARPSPRLQPPASRPIPAALPMSTMPSGPVMGVVVASGGGSSHPLIDPANVAKLVAMGFPEASCIQALIQSKGDVARAANRLLSS